MLAKLVSVIILVLLNFCRSVLQIRNLLFHPTKNTLGFQMCFDIQRLD